MALAIQKAESDIAADLKTVFEPQFAGIERRFVNIDHRFADIDRRFADLERHMDERLASLESRLEARFAAGLAETKADILRWNFAFWVAQLAAIAAILKLLR